MLCNVTLTAKEFSAIHNALCKLSSVTNQLEDVLKPSVMKDLMSVKNDVRAALESAYEQENQMFDTRNEIYSKIKKDNKFVTDWSMYEVEDPYAPHNWQGVTMMQYCGKVVTDVGTTWVDLWKAVDVLVKMSDDMHHTFVEAFYNRDGVLEVSLGS